MRSATPPLPPPCDIDAEAAVLSALFLNASTEPVRGKLRETHFYAQEHRLVYRALLDLERRKQPIDALTLRNHLRELGVLETVGGAAFLARLFDATPSIANVSTHADIVIGKARVREIQAVANQLIAAGYLVNGESDAYAAQAIALMQAAAAPPIDQAKIDRVQLIGAETLFAKLPPVPWICRDLALCPGRPTMVVGYGYSGKTLAVQSLALSVATGTPIWGRYPCKRTRVMHLDYEQGFRATAARYQRIAAPMGITPHDLQGWLHVSIHPGLYLTSTDAFETLIRLIKTNEIGLVVIDAFRPAVLGVDENDSRVREYVDLLSRVSEQTGCMFILIHHAGKPKESSDARATPRGSSAIFDACGTVLVLARQADGSVKVEAVKQAAEAAGKAPEAFAMHICDVEENGQSMGLSITASEIESSEPNPAKNIDKLKSKVIEFLRDNPTASGNAIAEQLGGRRAAVFAAIESLVRDGFVTNTSTRARPVWGLTDAHNA